MVPPCHSAWGHGVNIFAWLEGDTVYVESKFKGGKRVRAGSIVVMDMQGHELLSGITNENGEFSFKIPRREDLKIALTAGAGHRAEWTLAASDMGEWPDTATATERAAATDRSALLEAQGDDANQANEKIVEIRKTVGS